LVDAARVLDSARASDHAARVGRIGGHLALRRGLLPEVVGHVLGERVEDTRRQGREAVRAVVLVGDLVAVPAGQSDQRHRPRRPQEDVCEREAPGWSGRFT
jgi:hypothetical protein